MASVLLLEWPSQLPYKLESEDAAFVDQSRGIYVVSDGITRDRNEAGEYPNPSPARLAATAAVSAIGQTLTNLEVVDEASLLQAFKVANGEIRRLNEDLGLWDNHDYLTRDLAGCVVACAVAQTDAILFGNLGDCRVALFAQTGELLFETSDGTAAARVHFPTIMQVGRTNRFLRVRRDFRNRPLSDQPGFGALTGEDTALPYVRVGQWQYSPGNTLVLFSDGMAPFIHENHEFVKLIIDGPQEEIAQFISDRSSIEEYADDKTLIIVR